MTSDVAATTTGRQQRSTPAWLVAGAFAVAAALGFGGNFAPVGPAQDLLYAVSAAGLVLGAILLALQHAATGHMFGAAGFAVLALGESRLLNPTDAPGGEASFAAGVLLYVPALLLIASTPWGPAWARVTAALGAVPFALHALAYFAGLGVELDGPLPSIGYALLTVTMIGWILTVLRRPGAGPG